MAARPAPRPRAASKSAAKAPARTKAETQNAERNASRQAAQLNRRARQVSKVAGNIAVPGRGGVKTVKQAQEINKGNRNAAATYTANANRYRQNVARKKP